MTAAVLLALCAAAAVLAAADPIVFDRAAFKVSKVEHGEKVSRVRAATDGATHTSDTIALPDGVEVSSDDTLSVQASFKQPRGGDNDGEADAAFPEQAFLRVCGTDTGRDALFALGRKGLDMRLDLALRRELRADPAFWGGDAAFRVELVLGDARLDVGRTWVLTERLTVRAGDVEAETVARRVFDFDVRVRQTTLPEFDTPLPRMQRRAGAGAVAAGVAGVAAPVGALAVAWARMGVAEATRGALARRSGAERAAALGLQVCVGVHAVALGLFWTRWSIVTTGKVVGAAMVPTVVLGRMVLATAGTTTATGRR